MEHIEYSQLKAMCLRLFSAQFPWEVQLPIDATEDDKILLALLWNSFIYQVPSAPVIPNNLWRS